MTTAEHDQGPAIEASSSQSRFTAVDVFQGALDLLSFPFRRSPDRKPPKTSPGRQHASTEARSLDKDNSLQEKILQSDPAVDEKSATDQESAETVLYLAYGSNLSSKTFLGTRGIKPLSQINVVVPELRLTFDMPGLPYFEPCFAATRFRTAAEAEDAVVVDDEGDEGESSENDHLITHEDYHKDTWLKPLIGVVYEVTLPDYARIIATEGGGRGYKDIVVDCYPFPASYNPSDPIPDTPTTVPFKAHSLLSPAVEESRHLSEVDLKRKRGSGVRPDPSHAQPSARYLGLIKTGADEHALPLSYRAYLAQIRPFRITSRWQTVGGVLFAGCWVPSVLLTMALSRALAGPDGRSPYWLIVVMDVVWRGMWMSYDAVFRRVFGDGERTIGDT